MTYRMTILDLETTGLSQPDGHKIIEIGLSMYATDNGIDFRKVGSTLCKRINPKRPIDEKAQAVHGISLDMLKGCPMWEEVAPKVGKIFRVSNLIVAHNTPFDIPFIAGEFDRVGEAYGNPEVFCTMQNGRQATAMGTVPNLGILCWALGVPYDADSAHNAGYDVDVTAECLFKGIQSGMYKIESLEEFKRQCLEEAA